MTVQELTNKAKLLPLGNDVLDLLLGQPELECNLCDLINKRPE